MSNPTSDPVSPTTTSWVPRTVLVTRSARDHAHTDEILRRCAAAGIDDVQLLPGDRLTGLRGATERETYAAAKRTLAVVVAPPSTRKPQPIPPSADWRIDLARGCPAHCQYCYLAGSLAGPPITRVYANLDEILAPIPTLAGQGTVTTGNLERAGEGTTFELSCYTDPLAIEAVTGSVSAAIAKVGRGELGDGVSLRFTSKYDEVDGLLGLTHAGRTRVRMSVNSPSVSRRFEGGTASVVGRLDALRRLASDGYPIGLTVAPVMPLPDWRAEYGQLLDDAAAALSGVDGDLTVELITHRFTESSRATQLEWYPNTKLDLDPANRIRKFTKFGSPKYVYPKDVMAEMREWFDAQLPLRLPQARPLYWT